MGNGRLNLVWYACRQAKSRVLSMRPVSLAKTRSHVSLWPPSACAALIAVWRRDVPPNVALTISAAASPNGSTATGKPRCNFAKVRSQIAADLPRGSALTFGNNGAAQEV